LARDAGEAAAQTWRVSDTAGSEQALAHLVDNVINHARERRNATAEWQLFDSDFPPKHQRIATMYAT
jgi:hypothetical protein